MSGRRFYPKIIDIYTTTLDYNKSAKTTRLFFAKMQNKLHWAIYRYTAAELVNVENFLKALPSLDLIHTHSVEKSAELW